MVLAAAFVAGCGKKNATPDTVPTPAADAAAPAPAAPPTAATPTAPLPPVALAAADYTATLAKLTAELRRYEATAQTQPRTFEEFIAQDSFSFPPPPAGKKYFVWRNAVVLR